MKLRRDAYVEENKEKKYQPGAAYVVQVESQNRKEVHSNLARLDPRRRASRKITKKLISRLAFGRRGSHAVCIPIQYNTYTGALQARKAAPATTSLS